MDDHFECECGRVFENHQSRNAHYRWCEVHKMALYGHSEVAPSWQKGKQSRLKGRTLDEFGKNPDLTRSRLSIKSTGRAWTAEQRQKMSIATKGKNGGLRVGCNHWKKIKYNGIWLDSSYELRFVQVLDTIGIYWIKNSTLYFNYTFDGSIRKYYPDFYLPEIDKWIEIKGWIKDIDYAKWNDFPKDLVVINKDRLNELEIRAIGEMANT